MLVGTIATAKTGIDYRSYRKGEISKDEFQKSSDNDETNRKRSTLVPENASQPNDVETKDHSDSLSDKSLHTNFEHQIENKEQISDVDLT